MRVGIIGLGKMGLVRARELRALPDVTIDIVSDVNPERFAVFPDAHSTESPQEVLNADLDAVFICTPNAFTANLVVAALRNGKHVFAEKPPGRSIEDVEKMIWAERESSGQVLKFGFNHRYHAAIQEAKRIIDSGILGEVLWVRGVYGKGDNAGFENSWRNDRDLSGGGILIDQGIHMLDLFRLFCEDFIEVKSMVTRAFYEGDVEDNAFALMRDGGGRIAMLHSSSTQWKHRFHLEVFTAGGYLSVNGILSSTRSYGDETLTIGRRGSSVGLATGKPREEMMYFDKDPSWRLEVEEFIQCVRDGLPVQHGTSHDALRAMQLVDSIYKGDDHWTDGETSADWDAAGAQLSARQGSEGGSQ